MSSSLDKLKALTNRLEEKIGIQENHTNPNFEEIKKSEEKFQPIDTNTTDQSISIHSDEVRSENIQRVKLLYDKLNIYEKSPNFETIFIYKAMNLSGIGLKEEDFARAREGKYIQIIAITYEPDKNGKKKAKNISLGYFGKAETLEAGLKNDIIEFVLRWRYEKAFQNVQHYKHLIEKIERPSEILS